MSDSNDRPESEQDSAQNSEQDSAQNNDKDLKDKILKGGLSLAVRQIVTSGLSLVSILVVARVLGPEQYGIVAFGMGIFYFLVWINKLGIGVYVTRVSELSADAPRQILALFNQISLVTAVVLWVSAPAIAAWTKQPETLWVVRCLALPLWFEMVGDASIMLMFRELQFAEVGVAEAIGQLANYGLAIPLVLTGKGYWGPIWGLTLQQLVVMVMVWRHRPIPWGWRWTKGCIFPALQGGLAYTGSASLLSLKALTVPLLVTRLAGVEAAGIVSIAVRFADQLAILRQVLNQMSISVLSKFMGQPERIRAALSQGMVYQVLLVAPACAVFSCCAAWLIPLLFGDEWLRSTQIFPMIAAGVILSTLFELHTSTLYAAAKNREVAIFNATYISLQWITALIVLPIVGIWGYGFAELATIPSYGVIHRSLTKLFGSPDYKNAFLLVAATFPALFAGPWIPVPLGLLLLAVSYGLVLLISPELKALPMEILKIWKSRHT